MGRTSVVRAAIVALGLAGCIITPGNSDDGDTETETEGSSATTPGSGTGPGSASGTLDDTGGGSANARCEDFCEELVGAMCTDGPTMPGCLLTCEALTSSATCEPTAHAYFDCVQGAGISCNSAGQPVAEGCGLEYLLAIGCAVTENPNPDIVQPCSDYCDNVSAAACENNAPVADCNTDCLWLGATGTGCGDQWGLFLECANAANISCVLGYAVAEGCGAEAADYWVCINEAGGGGG